MPDFLYEWPLPLFFITIVLVCVVAALIGLWLTRHYLQPLLVKGENTNDAVSGAVQAIGVFYGVTVGLIAIGVWDTNSKAVDIASQEAALALSLYINATTLPEHPRLALQDNVQAYLTNVIDVEWEEQKRGKKISHQGRDIAPHDNPDAMKARTRMCEGTTPRKAWEAIKCFRDALAGFEPQLENDKIAYAASLDLVNRLSEQRRLRTDIAKGGLRPAMWAVIYFGAIISIGIVFLFRITRAAMHATIVSLMAAFLGVVLFMIGLNDRPYRGEAAIDVQPYKSALKVIDQMYASRTGHTYAAR